MYTKRNSQTAFTKSTTNNNPSPATLAQQYDKEIFDSEWDKTDDSSTTIATTTARSVEQVDSPESEDQFPTKQFPVELKESDTEPEKDKVEEEWHEMGLLNTTAAALPALTTTTPKDPEYSLTTQKKTVCANQSEFK
uniref:Uncharacterized protein n=1 Tax=Ditylenchus dipsaci TaxID=166011 RepID=A0A915DG76_9BILA